MSKRSEQFYAEESASLFEGVMLTLGGTESFDAFTHGAKCLCSESSKIAVYSALAVMSANAYIIESLRSGETENLGGKSLGEWYAFRRMNLETLLAMQAITILELSRRY